MKPRALVRAFNLLLTFDTVNKDNVLEQETHELIEEINKVLAQEFPGAIPQLQVENPDKKLKLGIRIYTKKDHEDLESDDS